MNPSVVQIIGTALFGLAIIHTFSTKFFERLSHQSVKHAGLWHLLGEIEIVFGFWAMVLMLAMVALEGKGRAVGYLDSRTFTEPMFVFAIMVIAGSRPILKFTETVVRGFARLLPRVRAPLLYFTVLTVVPLLGSFITEPAAMTVAALTLQKLFFTQKISNRLKYVTLGVLFVNISIGGTLTPFAAPPVLMVAGRWGWDLSFMLATFGWKAVLAVLTNATLAVALFQRELRSIKVEGDSSEDPMSIVVIGIHLFFLALVVIFAHHPAVFMGLFLFFLGFTAAYQQYQDRLLLREGLLVAFFLAGLVVIGGMQEWWLQPLLTKMNATAAFFGAAGLTAFTDNAALTYLGSLVEGLSDQFKYSLVAGAVAGGGLTVIANAPNPAGFAILRGDFPDGTISPLGLAAAAIVPTIIALLAFWIL